MKLAWWADGVLYNSSWQEMETEDPEFKAYPSYKERSLSLVGAGFKSLQWRKGGGCLQLLLGGILDGSVPPSQGPSSLGPKPIREDEEAEGRRGYRGWRLGVSAGLLWDNEV